MKTDERTTQPAQGQQTLIESVEWVVKVNSHWSLAVLSLCLFGLLCAPVIGQEQRSMTPQRAAEIDGHLANFRAVMATAKQEARSGGSPIAVEQRLASLIQSKVTTAVWHLELAQRLLHVASDLAAEGRGSVVRPLADRALQNTQFAAQLAAQTGKPEREAAAKTLEGTILEDYYGDIPAATRCFEAAVRLSPKVRQAQEKLARIQARPARTGGTKS